MLQFLKYIRVDVSLRIMISASQFQIKENISHQFLLKLCDVVKYDSIQLKNSVMGETLYGRGKFVYIHCQYDQSLIKKNKYLKKFLLEVIPSSYFSYNSVIGQKIKICKYTKFQKFLQQEREKSNIKNHSLKQNSLNQSMQLIPYPSYNSINSSYVMY